MIIEAFGTGATSILAIENAKRSLNAPEDAFVQVEVVEREKKKLFGMFGGTDAKARAWYEISDKEEAAPAPPPAKPVKQEKAKPEKTEKPVKAEKVQKTEKPAKNEVKKEAKPENKPAAKKDAPVKEKKAPAKEKKAETPAAPVQPAAIKVDTSDAVIDYLTAVIKAMGIGDVVVTGYTDASNVRFYSINSESDDGTGALIGRQGNTLDAFQHLARLVSNKAGENYSRITINVGDYREKRTDVLRAAAAKYASKVLKYGRNETLEPMNPYERRIIHTAIQEIEGVNSHSIGSGDNRRVVISLDEGVEPQVKSSGRRNGRPAPKKEAPTETNGEEKAARQDSASTSRYGKIEVAGSAPREKKKTSKAEAAPAKPVKQDSAGASRYGRIEVRKAAPEEKTEE